MSLILVAKSVLVNPEGKILVLRRSKTDPHAPGRVDFPGGGVDEGEELLAAAVREIQEETGIEVAAADLQLGFAYTSEPNAEGDIITRLLFIGKIATATVNLSYEHDAFWWHEPAVALNDFDHTTWSNGLRFILENSLV